MKPLTKNIRSFFQRFKRNPKVQPDVSAANEPSTSPRKNRRVDRFSVISWVVTLVIVAALLSSTLYYKSTRPVTYTAVAQPTSASEPGTGSVGQPQAGEPVVGAEGSELPSILRKLQLITNIPERPRYGPTIYRVSRGDAMLSIAEEFKLKSESILYVNTQLEDNPHNLKPGMELTIPPVDGLYYEWKDSDTFESVAEKFDAIADDIINFPGNDIDLTDPKVEPGTLVMIPGGARDLRAWEQDLQTAGRGANTGTGGANATNSCGGGPVASGFGWPANSHNITGNGYGPGHLGIDIEAAEGDPVYAAGTGIVTMAQGGWNYGYGNVVQIDHGNGYVTVYAHLSAINVSQCTPVGQGTVVGAAGNTGNSFGAHLHFEVRIGGSNINPYDIVQ
ncbi:MAG: M23 family metallopeptidase [Anaerolineales bacterium]|nr:M23 family metallopeptidase [Anaerolineales bacterium]